MAAPAVSQIGDARVSVIVSPDPPAVGTNAVTVQISGASAPALNSTSVRYSTIMPSMNMGGPSGVAARIAGRSDEWRFNVNFGMAAPWTLRVQLSGGVSGSVDANLVVGQTSRASTMQNMPVTSSNGSMAGMNMAGGDAAAWRNATFALIGVILIGALVLWRNRRPFTIALVVVAGLAVVGLAYAQSRYGSPAMDMASMQSVPGSAPVPVTLARVGGDANTTMIQAPANVQPYLTQNIVARAPGLLADFNSYTGDRLKAGEVIAHLLEPELQRDARAAAADAEAARIEAMHHAPNGVVIAQNDAAAAAADVTSKARQLAYWKNEIHRERELLSQGAVSQQEYENEVAQAAAADAAYHTSQSALNSAQTRVGDANASLEMAQAQAIRANETALSRDIMAGYTNIIVPSDSVVMKRLVDPGVYVQPGTPILQVGVVDRLRVQAQVAQQDLPGVVIGTPMDVAFDDGKVLHGRISSVSPVVDPSSHTAIAEAIVPNTGALYQPGGFVHVVLHARALTNATAFSVPSGAIVGGANSAVWTDVNGAARRVAVSVISDDGTTAQVSGNLRPGMRVVVTGASNLEEGQPIAESGS